MENASKALLMAAGVLMSLIIIGAFMLMMSYLNGYQGEVEQSKKDAQLTEFNVLFDTYNRQNIRGNEMISLMNRIIDYNSRKTDEGWESMNITLTIDSEIRKALLYDESEGNQIVTDSTYTQGNINQISGNSKIADIEKVYEVKYATQLAKQIANIKDIIDSGGTDGNQEGKFDEKKWLPQGLSKYKKGKYAMSAPTVDNVYKDASIYYEYINFKRTKFDCTNVRYGATGRIVKMEFKCTGIGE